MQFKTEISLKMETIVLLWTLKEENRVTECEVKAKQYECDRMKNEPK